MYKIFFKRFFDLIFSILILLMIIPFLVVCVIMIKLDSKGPVFFLQERVGCKGKVFKIYKFRTMTNKVHSNKYEIFSNNTEVTIIGHFLRKYKIDELPQLLNVVKGDLSLIGPRPLLRQTNVELGEAAIIRQQVRPGLSGLAQVNGNIYISREERIKFDIYYVMNLNFVLDVKILFKTVFVIFKGEEKFANN